MATATKTVKAPNYTAEQTAKMVADYKAGVTVESIAETLGKSVRSVVAKLSREKVYQAKVYVSKTGEPVAKKDDTADAIGKVLRLSENDTSSLAKANKVALRAILNALDKSVDESVHADKIADMQAQIDALTAQLDAGSETE